MTDLTVWSARQPPDLRLVMGRSISIAPANFREDTTGLYNAIGGAENNDLWRYIPFGPCTSSEELSAVLKFTHNEHGWQTHIIRTTDAATVLGMASYMRIRPEHGSAEIGCIVFSKALQRTPAATEAMYMMARHLFETKGYRRYEWKCDNANAASKRAAERLGFTFEGVFRQDMVVKGENRDTAWFSITDREWPRVKAAFETWLAEDNFDGAGAQRQSLSDIRAAL